ncbi:MAG: MipA/OmpV family protein [Betaproteobacteria bacterium]|nr:MipA/OmpV family protein [Betaproteobacteria bacterium]
MGKIRRRAATALALAAALAWAAGAALANSDPLAGVLSTPGAAGLGAAWRFERSPYRGAGTRVDLVPLYLYEGEYAYLHAYRVGLKLDAGARHRFDVFLSHRFEGFPYDRIPQSLAGMAERQPGLDFGASYELRGDWGAAYAEVLGDAIGASHGRELRLGYKYEWRSGRLRLRPHATLALRNARLNNYYYGVLPAEASSLRPAYEPGAGVNGQLGLYGAYALTERWRLLAGLGATRWSQGVRASPIVNPRFETSAALGLLYEFSPEHETWPEKRPLLLRLYTGRASECDVAKVVRLVCTSTDTPDQTRVVAAEFGRPFVERLNGWPFDVVGYLGLLRHRERGVQPDVWQLNAYMKGIWYGFPWRERLMTRIGLGVGASYAHGVPLLELRDQQKNGRNTSRLLNYLDPTIDFSLGDLLGVRSLKRTFLGLGVSHRSGIFATSQLLGNVSGGSNYIYSYVEWEM